MRGTADDMLAGMGHERHTDTSTAVAQQPDSSLPVDRSITAARSLSSFIYKIDRVQATPRREKTGCT